MANCFCEIMIYDKLCGKILEPSVMEEGSLSNDTCPQIIYDISDNIHYDPVSLDHAIECPEQFDVLHFSGLLDCNEKRIFDHHVIEVPKSIFSDETELRCVVYCANEGRFVSIDKNGRNDCGYFVNYLPDGGYGSKKSNRCQIIGFIYDYPELQKGVEIARASCYK